MDFYASECIKQDKGMHRVTFSDGFVYDFTKEEILEYFLYDPSYPLKLSPKDLASEVNLKRAKRNIIKYLNYGIRTEQEVHRKLEREGFEHALIGQAIEFAKEKEYINDEDYAGRYVRTSLNTKIESRNTCMNKLIEKGIPKDRASEACLLIDDNEQIRKLLLKDSIRKREPLKLKQYLFSKGFSLNDINKAIGEL